MHKHLDLLRSLHALSDGLSLSRSDNIILADNIGHRTHVDCWYNNPACCCPAFVPRRSEEGIFFWWLVRNMRSMAQNVCRKPVDTNSKSCFVWFNLRPKTKLSILTARRARDLFVLFGWMLFSSEYVEWFKSWYGWHVARCLLCAIL